jgi:hypothetical protein
VEVGQIDKSATMEGDVCEMYRQNQFKLQCTLRGEINDYTTPAPSALPTTTLAGFINSPSARSQIVSVDGLYFHLFAFRQSEKTSVDTKNPEVDLVPLHQVGPSRTKRDMQTPDLLSIHKGSGIFDKLQFQASTHLGSDSFFHVVVCVVARVEDKMYCVCASKSPKFIVHARNPGRAGKLAKRASPPLTDSAEQLLPHAVQTPMLPSNTTAVTTPIGLIPPQFYPEAVVQPLPLPLQYTLPSMGVQPQMPQQYQPIAMTSPQYSTTLAGASMPTLPPQPITITLPNTSQQYILLPSQSFSSQAITPQPTVHVDRINSSPTQQQPSPPQLTYPSTLVLHHTPPTVHSPPQHQAHSPPQLSPPQLHDSNVLHSQNIEQNGWIQNGDATYYYGRVGVNTNTPQEALTVNGNIMVTGNLLKPSDMRLKDNFAAVSPALQLNVISNIKIYDYDVQAGNGDIRRERGVIAQEVAKLLPEAVQPIGEYKVNGRTIDNLLVVNERVLLLENIGATQKLHQLVDADRAEIDAVASKINELEQEELKNSSMIMSTLQNMASYILSEDFREGASDSIIHCGFSLFGLGPAWSMFVLGFAFPPSWILGSLYLSASNPVKRVAGVANFMMSLVFALLVVGFIVLFKQVVYRSTATVLITGVIFLIVITYFKRKREKLRNKVMKKDFLAQINNVKNNDNADGGNANKRTARSVVVEM